LSVHQQWLQRFWPSRRLLRDPLADVLIEHRYAPVSIANWKLTPWIAKRLLAGRCVQPLTFSTRERLTVVIPFRDRDAHLQQLLPVLTATLREQAIEHRILIVEQAPGGLFNRGKLINVGMHYAADLSDYYCIHDVDAVPIVADYRCPSQPLRLVHTIVTETERTTRTDYYFSGAVSVRKEQAYAAGGFSNEYWGWGKEDDDFFFRLLLAGCVCYYDTRGEFRDLPNPHHQQVVRKSPTTPPHVKENRRRRSLLLRGLAQPAHDGLPTLRYELLEHRQFELYEKILVKL
jgi:hypothetical protein